MKKIVNITSIWFAFILFILIACQEDSPDQLPEEANLDEIYALYTGDYICEVSKMYYPDSVIESYIDTIQVSRKGNDHLIIESTRNITLPETQFSGGNTMNASYLGLLTIIAFSHESLIEISHGPDSAFYMFSGQKVLSN